MNDKNNLLLFYRFYLIMILFQIASLSRTAILSTDISIRDKVNDPSVRKTSTDQNLITIEVRIKEKYT